MFLDCNDETFKLSGFSLYYFCIFRICKYLILAWDGRTYATNQQPGANVCSPSASSPDHIDRTNAVASFTALGSYTGSSCVGGSLPSLSCGMFGSVSIIIPFHCLKAVG